MKLQKACLIYLAINITYITPMFFTSVWWPAFLESMVLRYYVMSVVLYYFFGTFIHMIFSVIIAVRSIRYYKENKSKKMLCISLIITITDILINVAWSIFGRAWTIQ